MRFIYIYIYIYIVCTVYMWMRDGRGVIISHFAQCEIKRGYVYTRALLLFFFMIISLLSFTLVYDFCFVHYFCYFLVPNWVIP